MGSTSNRAGEPGAWYVLGSPTQSRVHTAFRVHPVHVVGSWTPRTFQLGVILENRGRFWTEFCVARNKLSTPFLVTGSLVRQICCREMKKTDVEKSVQRGVLRSVAGGFQKYQCVHGDILGCHHYSSCAPTTEGTVQHTLPW